MYATIGISLQPPASRREIPILTLKSAQIRGLLERLQTFWKRFASLFQRREQREWGLKYLQGRLMDGEERYTQPLARRLGEKNGRAMQNLIGASPWDDQALLEEHQRAAQETLGEPEGLVIMYGRSAAAPQQASPARGASRPGALASIAMRPARWTTAWWGCSWPTPVLGAIPCWIAGCTCLKHGSVPHMPGAVSAAASRTLSPFAPIKSWSGRCWKGCLSEG
jgi:hypothetical protein